MCVRSHTHFLSALLVIFAPTASFGNEGLASYDLSDSEIHDRCRNSIRHRVDLVEVEGGRKITRCEQTYLTMRTVARDYASQEHGAQEEVHQAVGECRENSTQENCLASGRSVADAAARSHERMAHVANRGERALAALDRAPGQARAVGQRNRFPIASGSEEEEEPDFTGPAVIGGTNHGGWVVADPIVSGQTGSGAAGNSLHGLPNPENTTQNSPTGSVAGANRGAR